MDNSNLFLSYFLAAGIGILATWGIGVLISIYCERRRNNTQINERLINYV